MDEPSDVSDDENEYDTFDDTFVLTDDEDDDDDDIGGATKVMSLVEVLGSSPPPPPPRRQKNNNNNVVGLIEALGSSPPLPMGKRRMTTAGTGTTPRSSPFGHMSMGPSGALPLRSPSWASKGSTTPSLARKSSMMSFKSLRRKVSSMSIGGGGGGSQASLKEE